MHSPRLASSCAEDTPDGEVSKIVTSWEKIRDATNLGITAIALIVSVLSLWTAAKVSDVEDFFKSEIVRRNTDLNITVRKARQIESRSLKREEYLEAVQQQTEQALQKAADADIILADAKLEIADTKRQVDTAAIEYKLSELNRLRLSGEISKLRESSEIFFRQSAARRMITLINNITNAPTDSKSSSLIEILQNIDVDAEPVIANQMTISKRRMATVCPDIRNIPVMYPPNLTKFDVERDHSPGHGRESEMDEYMVWHINHMNKIQKRVQECVCRSLADASLSRDRVCPPQENASPINDR